VLLKNNNDILPLSKKTKNIHVAGIGANDIGMQCGGWTLEWQGKMGPITEGTTILDGIKSTVSKKTEITYSKDGLGGENAEVGIIVIGEEPYAEGIGDKENLSLSKQDILVIENMKKLNIPLVVIMLSGRPLIVSDEINSWDAFIAAWLPGTEGDGISDILFGNYKPTGKLAFSWPKSMDQIPHDYKSNTVKPLFDYKFGLTY
jgi:beta-glucosidase